MTGRYDRRPQRTRDHATGEHCVPGNTRTAEVTRSQADLARLARKAAGRSRYAAQAQAQIPAAQQHLNEARKMLADHRAGCPTCSTQQEDQA